MTPLDRIEHSQSLYKAGAVFCTALATALLISVVVLSVLAEIVPCWLPPTMWGGGLVFTGALMYGAVTAVQRMNDLQQEWERTDV